jgi:hypothetical protein
VTGIQIRARARDIDAYRIIKKSIHLKNISGKGYRFIAEVSKHPDAEIQEKLLRILKTNPMKN